MNNRLFTTFVFFPNLSLFQNLNNRSGSESVVSIHEWNQLFNNKKLGQKSFCYLFQKKLRDQGICHELTFSDLSKVQ